MRHAELETYNNKSIIATSKVDSLTFENIQFCADYFETAVVKIADYIKQDKPLKAFNEFYYFDFLKEC